VNDARFYPDLHPTIYPDLVDAVATFARDCDIQIFDGSNFVGQIKLADHMHFSIESTETIVAMYCDAIHRMLQGTTPPGLLQPDNLKKQPCTSA
jgi:hypothetical protein